MIVAITGGRFYEPSRECLKQFLDLLDAFEVTELHHGASGSVDWGVSTLVRHLMPSIKVRAWPVNTNIDGEWPAAGCNRNGRMLRDSKSEMLFSFIGNNGTRDCTLRAIKMKLAVYKWSELSGEWE